jgi:putative membrane protein
MYGPFNHGWMFDGGSGMLFGFLWMALIWAIPLLLLAALLKYLFTRSSGRRKVVTDELIEPDIQIGSGQQIVADTQAPLADKVIEEDKQTPLEILKIAYARGELSRGEFLQKRDDILEK